MHIGTNAYWVAHGSEAGARPQETHAARRRQAASGERVSASSATSQHQSSIRLEPSEYDARTALAATAKLYSFDAKWIKWCTKRLLILIRSNWHFWICVVYVCFCDHIGGDFIFNTAVCLRWVRVVFKFVYVGVSHSWFMHQEIASLTQITVLRSHAQCAFTTYSIILPMGLQSFP